MKFFGAHVSIAGGPANAPLNAKAIGADGFAMFTKNQRQWQEKPLESSEIAAFRANCEACGYTPARILPHDGYLINLGQPDAAGTFTKLGGGRSQRHECDQTTRARNRS